MPPDLSKRTGSGVKVVVIDDGIDPLHPDVGQIEGGVRITLNEEGHITYTAEYHGKDAVNHGTLCAAIIRRKAPQVDLYSVKILDEELRADPRLLVAALEWCVENQIQVINLSLGTRDSEYARALHQSCQSVCENGGVIVCATHPGGYVSFPAALPSVIAVGGNDYYEDYEFTYHPGSRAEFLARGLADTGQTGQRGTSFAAARISAIVALIVEKHPAADLEEVKRVLIANACPRKPRWVYTKDSKESDKPEKSSTGMGAKGSWIRKAVLYPYDESMDCFARFPDLCSLEIAQAIDPFHPGLAGTDMGEAMGCGRLGVEIQTDLGEADGADTLILAPSLLNLWKITKQDPVERALRWAIEQGINVYSLFPLPRYRWRNIWTEAERQGLVIMHPGVDWTLLELPLSVAGVDVPVIGVFGTSCNQGKLSTQLALRRQLLQEGYRICQIGADPRGELFGFDAYMPQNGEALLGLSLVERMALYQRLMRRLWEREHPHIFVVGAAGGVVPHALYSLDLAAERGFSEAYTLPALSVLMAVQADGYVLTINPTDADKYIEHTIAVLEALGKGKVLAISMADKEKDPKESYSLNSPWRRQLSEEEMDSRVSELEGRLGIPVVCPFAPQGHGKLASTVIRHFAVK